MLTNQEIEELKKSALRVRRNILNQKTQVDAEHFMASGSKVMFVTYAQ